MVKTFPLETAKPAPVTFGTLGLGASIVVATVLAYLPSLRGDFIWNDSDYVTAPALRSLRGLARIWTEPGATQQYYPLLHSAFWVQHTLFGDNPLGYHVVTLLLHAGSAVLFALVLRRLFAGAGEPARRLAGAGWLAALLFALHPVNVESVAWITEQKNTLSLAFYLASALVYLRFDEARRPGTYVAALVLFVCSLLSKTMTATLPAALLVAFWWKRGRLGWRDVLPLLPWFGLGAVGGLFSGWVEKTYVGAQGADFNLSPVGRVLVAGRAIFFYIGKLAWPVGLNFIYPRWIVDPTAWWQWLYPLGAVMIGVALWTLRRRTRGPLAAYLFFVGSLFPALGFVSLYGARYSWVWDHWQYLPDLGLFALAGAGLAACGQVLASGPAGLSRGLVAALALLLGALTWSQCGMFHDNETLYRTTFARNPGAWMAHNNLGLDLSKMPGRRDDAIAQYEQALDIYPGAVEAHANLGNALSEMPGRLDDAIAQYEEALRLHPDYAETHNNLGTGLAKVPGREREAFMQFEDALRLRPDYPEAHNNLGLALAKMPGRLGEAVAQYEEALRLKPDFVEAHNNLGSALAEMPGRLNDAMLQYEEALRLNPDYAEAHNNFGSVLAEEPGRLPDAALQYEAALRLKPEFTEAHYNLGLALAKMPGRMPDALAQFRESVRLKPDFAPGWYNVGASWFQLGHMPEAAAAFREELRLTPDDPKPKQALAAALQRADGQ